MTTNDEQPETPVVASAPPVVAARGEFERLIGSAASFLGPTTLITGLLFYFGYAFTRARYAYFGVDADTIGLSTQDYVMRSPTPLLVPLLVLALIGATVGLGHLALRRRIAAATSTDEADAGRSLVGLATAARVGVALGLAALAAGALMLFAYAAGLLREWAPFSLVTALLTAAGAALVAYGLRVDALLDRGVTPRGAATAPLYLVLTASIFWATATIAPWSGRGEAHNDALHLDRLPAVILDTKERLYLTSPGIRETVLETTAGQAFHYRYRNLRLLIQGRDLMFLVPDAWSASDSTLILAMDGTARVQFQFQNSPP